jgi:NAD(P)-dependent dehydrogenase (short-subunit alcohol dehydrogenase family)
MDGDPGNSVKRLAEFFGRAHQKSHSIHLELVSSGFGSSHTYTAAKLESSNLTKSVALELAERGIRVNAVSPGGIAAAIFSGMFPAEMPTAWHAQPRHRRRRLEVSNAPKKASG